MDKRIQHLEKENCAFKSKVQRQTVQKASSNQKELANNVIISGIPNDVVNIWRGDQEHCRQCGRWAGGKRKDKKKLKDLLRYAR